MVLHPRRRHREVRLSPVSVEQGRRARVRRPWLRVLAAVLALVLVVVVGVGLFFYLKIRSGLDAEVTRRPLLPSATSAPQPGSAMPPRVRPTRPASAGDAQNILLIRNDAPGDAAARLGSVALAHIGRGQDRVDVLPLPVNVPAPVHGGAAPYAELYARGGAPALVAGVEDTIGVPVDQVAEFDPSGFEAAKSLMQPSTLANPVGLDDTLDRAMQGLVVDESFDRQHMQDLAFTMLENGVEPRTRPIASPLVAGRQGPDGVVPVPPHIDRLRSALIHDDPARLGS